MQGARPGSMSTPRHTLFITGSVRFLFIPLHPMRPMLAGSLRSMFTTFGVSWKNARLISLCCLFNLGRGLLSLVGRRSLAQANGRDIGLATTRASGSICMPIFKACFSSSCSKSLWSVPILVGSWVTRMRNCATVGRNFLHSCRSTGTTTRRVQCLRSLTGGTVSLKHRAKQLLRVTHSCHTGYVLLSFLRRVEIDRILTVHSVRQFFFIRDAACPSLVLRVPRRTGALLRR